MEIIKHEDLNGKECRTHTIMRWILAEGLTASGLYTEDLPLEPNRYCYVGEITPTSMQDHSFSKFNLLMKAYRYVLCHREAFGI